MRAGDCGDDGEAKARAATGPGPRRSAPIEALEESRGLCGGDVVAARDSGDWRIEEQADRLVEQSAAVTGIV